MWWSPKIETKSSEVVTPVGANIGRITSQPTHIKSINLKTESIESIKEHLNYLTKDLKKNLEQCYVECDNVLSKDNDKEILQQAKNSRVKGGPLFYINACRMYYKRPGNKELLQLTKCEDIHPYMNKIEELYTRILSLIKTFGESDTMDGVLVTKSSLKEIINSIKRIFYENKIYHSMINPYQPASRHLVPMDPLSVQFEPVEVTEGNTGNIPVEVKTSSIQRASIVPARSSIYEVQRTLPQGQLVSRKEASFRGVPQISRPSYTTKSFTPTAPRSSFVTLEPDKRASVYVSPINSGTAHRKLVGSGRKTRIKKSKESRKARKTRKVTRVTRSKNQRNQQS